jgi:DNA-directed RNA polymerase specialized sigma24 family protein
VRFAGQRLDLDLESAEELAARILAEVADRDGDACFRNDEHLLNHLKERLVWRWLDDVRRQKKVEPLADEAACVLDFDRPMMHALRQEVVREVFKQLTASRQKAISMLFEEQRSRAEVAKIFQVTEDTVTNWKRSFQDAVIRRARQEGLE